nr:uncharacterized protein LOC109177058 [Ipomoea batatas]
MLETSELEGNPMTADQDILKEWGMTADQVYDAVMGKKSGYIKGMGNGSKPVTSTSTRANNSHLEEKMKATMKENTQLKNEVQELKMKFERYEKLVAGSNDDEAEVKWRPKGGGERCGNGKRWPLGSVVEAEAEAEQRTKDLYAGNNDDEAEVKWRRRAEVNDAATGSVWPLG